MRSVNAGVAAAVVTVILACRGVSEANRVNPQLVDFRFSAEELARGQAVELVGALAPGESVGRADVVPVALRSGGGAEQQVHMALQRCSDESGALFVCDQLLVTLLEGRSVDELSELLNELDAQFVQFWLPSAEAEGGTVQLFSNRLAEARKRISAHPAVRTVDLNHIHLVGAAAPAEVRVSIRTTSPKGSDAGSSLRVSPGDTITARYVQPDGTFLEATAHMQ